MYQNKDNLSYIKLEIKIYLQNAVTFVLVKLDTKFKNLNGETKKGYGKIIERENSGKDNIISNGHTFPTLLREHYDMDIAIEKRI